MSRTLIATVLSFSVLLVCPTLVEGQIETALEDPTSQKVDRVEEARRWYSQNIKRDLKFDVYGLFEIKRIGANERTASGRFRWMCNKDKFNCRVEFRKQSGFIGFAGSLTESTYHLIGDGESVLIARFSSAISTGSYADLWDAGKLQYTTTCPYLPFMPGHDSRNIYGPKVINEHLHTLKQNSENLFEGKIEGKMELDGVDQIFRIQSYERDKPEFVYTGWKTLHNNLVLSQFKVIYEDDISKGPKSYEKIQFNADGSIRRLEKLTFADFKYEPNFSPKSFTVEAINFGPKSRIIDQRKGGGGTIRSPDGQFKSHGKSLAETIEYYRTKAE